MNIDWLKWLKIVRAVTLKFSENLENIKNVLLTIMIGVSLILTWSLWTFKPNYGVLESTRTVKKEVVADGKTIGDVVVPSQIIFHQGDRMNGLINHPLLNQVNQWLESSKFYRFSSNSELVPFDPNDNFNFKDNEYMEIVFPANMPYDVYSQVFPMDNNAAVYKLSNVDRIFLFKTSSNVVEADLVSYQEQRMLTVRTDLPFDLLKGQFQKAMQQKDAVPFMKIDVTHSSPKGDQVVKRFYLPRNPMNISSYKYLAQTVTDDTYDKYTKALFNDPLSVKSGSNDQGESYTDGNAALSINKIQNRFKFTNFAGGGVRETTQTNSPLLQSIDYINSHVGWGNPYVVSDLNSYTATFMLQIRNLPVLDDDMSMKLTWYQNELYEYERSLNELIVDDKNFSFNNKPETVILPSGIAVQKALQDYDLDNINDIRIGYTMKQHIEPHVYVLEPKWFINYGDNHQWQQLFKEDSEPTRGDTNGLEAN